MNENEVIIIIKKILLLRIISFILWLGCLDITIKIILNPIQSILVKFPGEYFAPIIYYYFFVVWCFIFISFTIYNATIHTIKSILGTDNGFILAADYYDKNSTHYYCDDYLGKGWDSRFCKSKVFHSILKAYIVMKVSRYNGKQGSLTINNYDHQIISKEKGL